jgi:hypothetical protein
MFQSIAILFVTFSLMMIPCGSKHVEIFLLQYSMNIQVRTLSILLAECCELSFFYMFLQVLCLCGRNVADLFNAPNQVPQSHIARCEADNFEILRAFRLIVYKGENVRKCTCCRTLQSFLVQKV